MAERRSLLQGLKSKRKADRQKEDAFVFGEEEKARPKARAQKPPTPKTQARGGEEPPIPPAAPPLPPPAPAKSINPLTGRVPLTTRIRPDLATALKRASLERQLSGETPNTVQDIIEQALEPWLKAQGYLKD